MNGNSKSALKRTGYRSALFVLGFSMVFTAMGATATSIGQILTADSPECAGEIAVRRNPVAQHRRLENTVNNFPFFPVERPREAQLGEIIIHAQENLFARREWQLSNFVTAGFGVFGRDNAEFDFAFARRRDAEIVVMQPVVIRDESGGLLEVFRLERNARLRAGLKMLQSPRNKALVEARRQRIAAAQAQPAFASREGTPAFIRRLAQGLEMQI